MTTEENKLLVKELFEQRKQRNPSPFIEAMADDFTWHIPGSTAWSDTYAGKDDVRARLLEPLYEQFQAPSAITATRIFADADFVVAEAQGEAITKSGDRYANRYCFVIRLEDGKLKELTEYMDTALVDRVLQTPAWRAD